MRSRLNGRTRDGLRPLLLLAVCLAAPLLAAASCGGDNVVGTLRAPYSRDDLISDNRLLGTWANENDTLTFLGRENGHYLLGDFSNVNGTGDTTRYPPPPLDAHLFQMGNAEVLDWGAFATPGARGDLAGAHICIPIAVRLSGDTLWFSYLDSSDLPDDSTLASDSIGWIDRGDVRILRGPYERVRQVLSRYFSDTTNLQELDKYVRVPMGQGPDALPEEARGN